VAGVTLMHQFTRNYYPLPGIGNLSDLGTFAFQALFYPSEHVFRTVTPLWKNIQWSALPHELAYSVSIVAFIVLIVGGVLHLLRAHYPNWANISMLPTRIFASAAFCFVIVIPLTLLFYSPEWNDILKKLPIIGSTTSPYRWLIIYIPILSVLVGMASSATPTYSRISLTLCVLGIPLLNYMEDRNYYQLQNYNPTHVLHFEQAVRSGRLEPRIIEISMPRTESGHALLNGEPFSNGASSLFCYNPLFGYRLEQYRTGYLRPGPISALAGHGQLNFRNPACLLYPNENHCVAWDGFQITQIDDLIRFSHYSKFHFYKSKAQIAADAITVASLIGVALMLDRKSVV
jgi:hypothetical protein